MKVYMFYSKLNKEVFAVCAMNEQQAKGIINTLNRNVDMVDDYELASSFKGEVAAAGIITLSLYN